MIDCNNNDSQTFKNLQAAGIKSMVNTVADQKKTDDNTWGYLGSYNAYNSENASDSYAAAWYQASVQYTVTLPAGTHTIMVGSNEQRSHQRYLRLPDTAHNCLLRSQHR